MWLIRSHVVLNKNKILNMMTEKLFLDIFLMQIKKYMYIFFKFKSCQTVSAAKAERRELVNI